MARRRVRLLLTSHSAAPDIGAAQHPGARTAREAVH